MSNRIVVLLVSFFSISIQAHTILTGNSGSTTTTFDFSVGPVSFVKGFKGSISAVLTGADEEKSGNTYAVAQYSKALKQFIPVAVATATVNNVADQSNPLTGKKIKFLKHTTSVQGNVWPALVVDQTVSGQERFYTVASTTVEDANKPTEVKVNVVRSVVPNDAAGAVADHVVGFENGAVSDSSLGALSFGAVTQAGQDFGTGNSGIAAAKFVADTSGGGSLSMMNLNTGATGNQAVLFNNTVDAVKVGSDATFVTSDVSPVVDMHWDGALQRLYIALRVTSAAGATNGARALVVGRITDGKLYFDKFIPDDAVTGGSNNNIIAASDGYSASIYKVRTMHTSTGLDYLIVNGGNNAVAQSGIRTVANQVYAIPLTNLSSNADDFRELKNTSNHGIAAKISQDPTIEFNTTGNSAFTRRTLRTAATQASDLFTTSSAGAVVGAGTVPLILPGVAPAKNIQDMVIESDGVFVTVAEDYDEDGGQIQEPGVFHSQALFGEDGKIASWTPWVRVGGSDDKTYRVGLDASLGNIWYTTGSSSSAINTVAHGDWGLNNEDGLLGGTTSNAQVGLVATLAREFKGRWGGIQGFDNFDANNNAQGIPHSGLSNTTTLLASSLRKFALIKTGDNDGVTGVIKPYKGDFFTNLAAGASDTFPLGTGRIFTVEGPVINDLGPIVAQTVFSNATYSWIAVGGPGGLAILSNASGQGFLPSAMPTNFTFKKVGNYRFVKKIVGDGTYLYVLTSKSLDRVTINASSFASGTVQYTRLATPQDLGLGRYGSFSDVVIADKLAVVATNKGMFRIANGSSVKTGQSRWTQVHLNESPGPVFSLSFASSSTEFNSGLASNGQIYALSSYLGYDQARLYRFAVNEGATISENSLQLLQDYYKQGVQTYLASFGQFRGCCTSDGSMRFITRPLDKNIPMSLQTLPVSIKTASPLFLGNESTLVAADMPARGIIGNVVRSTASGAWLVFGDFGLRVSE